MRAVRTHDLSGPRSLRVDEIDPPRPAAGEIVVRVHAAGVNFPDMRKPQLALSASRLLRKVTKGHRDKLT